MYHLFLHIIWLFALVIFRMHCGCSSVVELFFKVRPYKGFGINKENKIFWQCTTFVIKKDVKVNKIFVDIIFYKALLHHLCH